MNSAQVPKPLSPAATPVAVTSALPKSLINALPVGAQIAKHVQAIEALVPELEAQLAGAMKAGPVQLARAFVVLHRLNERLLSEEKALKPLKAVWKDYKEFKVPEAFEQAGVPNVPLDEGFRVGVSIRTVASVATGQKSAAFIWLQENGAGDLIQETINASTLSAYAKQKGEKNEDLPDDIFKVNLMPNASVTKT